MKKIPLLLKGIVLITILLAGGCGPSNDPDKIRDLEEVIIYVKIYEKGDTTKLYLSDSSDPDSAVVNDLYTDVAKGTKVYWKLAENSALKKVKQIRPVKEDGEIIRRKAYGIFVISKYKRLNIPNDAEAGEEKYFLRVKDEDNNKWEIDPYLRIRGTDASPSRP